MHFKFCALLFFSGSFANYFLTTELAVLLVTFSTPGLRSPVHSWDRFQQRLATLFLANGYHVDLMKCSLHTFTLSPTHRKKHPRFWMWNWETTWTAKLPLLRMEKPQLELCGLSKKAWNWSHSRNKPEKLCEEKKVPRQWYKRLYSAT